MINRSIKAEPIWISTDCEGQIVQISPAADELLGANARGQPLSRFLPLHIKQMAFDMEVALTGWPSRRLAMLATRMFRPIVVEYLVSARFTTDNVELYWFFELRSVGNSSQTH